MENGNGDTRGNRGGSREPLLSLSKMVHYQRTECFLGSILIYFFSLFLCIHMHIHFFLNSQTKDGFNGFSVVFSVVPHHTAVWSVCTMSEIHVISILFCRSFLTQLNSESCFCRVQFFYHIFFTSAIQREHQREKRIRISRRTGQRVLYHFKNIVDDQHKRNVSKTIQSSSCKAL